MELAAVLLLVVEVMFLGEGTRLAQIVVDMLVAVMIVLPTLALVVVVPAVWPEEIHHAHRVVDILAAVMKRLILSTMAQVVVIIA